MSLVFPFDLPPATGCAIQISPGVWWGRLPLQASIDHVNIYLLASDEGWILVDSGNNTVDCQKALSDLLQTTPFAQMPIVRVIATHHHPDHIGQVGPIAMRGAEFLATRTTWLYGRVLQLDVQSHPTSEQIQFVQRAGLQGIELAAYARRPASNYANIVAPLPHKFHRLVEGSVLTIGARRWTVHIGNGHAPEQATLWSDDGLAIVGDQILPGISSNLSVHFSEPNADLLSDWFASCRRFQALATQNTLCLPGHNRPFLGIPTRCQQLIATYERALGRLLTWLDRPRSAVDCLNAIYGRSLSTMERPALIAEAIALLNHMHQQGTIQRHLSDNNTYLWRRIVVNSSNPTSHSAKKPEAV